MRVRPTSLLVRGEVFNNTSYALPQELGTEPHVIRPRRKKALAFQVGGRTVIVKSVNHPGTKGTHFMANGLQDALDGRDGWKVTTYRARGISESQAAAADAAETR